MPIYEFACPRCRVVFSFLSKRINPDRLPTCPKCGHKKMARQMSPFATPRGLKDSASSPDAGDETAPDLDDPKVVRAMSELESDMAHLDENNPRHLAHLMRKMKEMMPAASLPKELDIAIKRLESGEDPDKIEADMGDLLNGMTGDSGGAAGGGYTHDSGLYDY